MNITTFNPLYFFSRCGYLIRSKFASVVFFKQKKNAGQKARISLARACYNQADIYLLDDPLSAVDSHVGQHIFKHILSNESGLLRDRTRILVTNNLSVLPHTDYIYVLQDGKLIEQGHYEDLMKRNNYLANLVQQYRQDHKESDDNSSSENDNNDDDDGYVGGDDNKPILNSEIPHDRDGNYRDDVNSIKSSKKLSFTSIRSRKSSRTQSNLSNRNIENNLVNQNQKSPPLNNVIDRLIEKETTETGQVKFMIYVRYFKAVSIVWCLATIINYVLSQTSNAGAIVWLSIWSQRSQTETNMLYSTTLYYLAIYGLIGALQGLFNALGWISMTEGTIGSSRSLHNRMLESIFHSPMSFFDITPLGRILNRFSGDIDVIDNSIQDNLRGLIFCVFGSISTMIIISIEIPIFLTIIGPVAICFYLIQKLFISTARQLKRIESITRSPIYSHFSETLSGVTSIRAYAIQEEFIEKINQNVDKNNSLSIALIIANRWLGIRLELIANFIVLFAAIFAVIYRNEMDPSSVGLIISYALSTTQNLNFLVRTATELETNIVAAERICQYTDLRREAEWIVEGNNENDRESNIPKNWPCEGRIEFLNYSTRYREGSELVLKQISTSIRSCERIGIVGRTGAGKSSLTLALFRLIEPVDGTIKIDGVNISKIGLHQLRRCLTIIPQDPVLFSGTIRSNLDPFDKFTDEQLWRCLEQAHLKRFVQSLDSNLQYKICESGTNLSVGQRQLICLARALLRKTKILVLDEATAAVDLETDSLIQETIKQSFNDCTILTIAHRLNTILDYDRILVLNGGKIAEFDSPENLLSNSSSIFYSMVNSHREISNDD
ncbi:hypothetical protein NH340_JMT05908 [Sarcoptes scabiei]|nr:hypothetical protein NH340_JMT05908 [Sarcoptes scabiei]